MNSEKRKIFQLYKYIVKKQIFLFCYTNVKQKTQIYRFFLIYYIGV